MRPHLQSQHPPGFGACRRVEVLVPPQHAQQPRRLARSGPVGARGVQCARAKQRAAVVGEAVRRLNALSGEVLVDRGEQLGAVALEHGAGQNRRAAIRALILSKPTMSMTTSVARLSDTLIIDTHRSRMERDTGSENTLIPVGPSTAKLSASRSMRRR